MCEPWWFFAKHYKALSVRANLCGVWLPSWSSSSLLISSNSGSIPPSPLLRHPFPGSKLVYRIAERSEQFCGEATEGLVELLELSGYLGCRGGSPWFFGLRRAR